MYKSLGDWGRKLVNNIFEVSQFDLFNKQILRRNIGFDHLSLNSDDFQSILISILFE